VGGLVLLSLVLITVSFRSTALDGVQGTTAGILRPFEIAADRVSRPFRDAAGWMHGLIDAKSENKKLKRQVDALRQQLVYDESAVHENVRLRQQLEYQGPPSLKNFERRNAAVLTNPQSAFDESITIAAGTKNGLKAGYPVLASSGGLVGTIDRAWKSVARVTLLTDGQSGVTATDLNEPAAVGVIKRGNGGGDVLVFDRVSKAPNVVVGNIVITAGSLGKGALPSMFPRGLLIGTVSSVSNNDVDTFKSIQVQPFVDFSALQSVIVLVPKQ
jgi:rod shape-determining protein MreC